MNIQVKGKRWDGLYSPNLVLSTTLESLEPEHQSYPDHLKFIGPSFFQTGPNVSESLLLRLKESRKTGLTFLFVSFGTHLQHHKTGILKSLMQCVEQNDDLFIVFSLGQQEHRESKSDCHERLHVLNYINYDAILPCADVVLHSGSVGILYHTLKAGKPAVCSPFDYDQFDNAQRLSDRGLGVRLDGKKLTPSRIHSSSKQAMELKTKNPSRFREIQRACQAASPERVGANWIEKLCDSSHRHDQTPRI